MSERLIDTNILVYAYDVSETVKQPHGISDIVTENKKDFDKIPGIHVIVPF